MHATWTAAVAAAAIACAAPAALAQTYPAKPVRVIIPFPTGGGAEQATRIVANHLTKALGQPFVVEARPGGNTIIGAEAVAKSAPDGYTLFVCGPSTMTSNPVLYAGKLPYDPQRDFVPVGMVSKTPYFLVVPASLPAKSLPELLALAKAKPGELSYASNGNATTNHLGYEILARAGGATFTHVPYKGFGQAMPDLLSGRVSTIMADLFFVLPSIKSGQLRLLAVTSAERSPLMPDAPTVAEQGVPGFDIVVWFAMFAPAGTPPEVVGKLGAEMRKFLSTPEARDAYRQLGHEAAGSTPEVLQAVVAADREKYARVIREAGIRAE
jgi:tripartite-type tricarboxylate transporter receptor subunit TctC